MLEILLYFLLIMFGFILGRLYSKECIKAAGYLFITKDNIPEMYMRLTKDIDEVRLCDFVILQVRNVESRK